jgi:Sulfotransferase family
LTQESSGLNGYDDAIKLAAPCTLKKRVPDFFIVGHPKSGTTALYEMLRCHPEIYMPDVKEPNFFNFLVPGVPNIAEWHTSRKPSETLDDYLSLFTAAKPEQRIGEGSTFYLASETAASSIAVAQPAAQIIAILREPVSFLCSLHLQLVQNDVENEKDPRRAFALEDARRKGRHIPRASLQLQPWLLYSDHVRYVDQLQRYQALFPGHVMVLIYDDFRRDNEETLRKVLGFLDVDDALPTNITKANPTVHVRSRYINHVTHSVTMGQGPVSRATKTVIKMLTSRQLRQHALQAIKLHVIYGNPPPPDAGLITDLRRRFKPEVVALSEYLGRDFVSLWGYGDVG